MGVVLLGVAIEVWVANSDQPHAFGDAVLRAFEDIPRTTDRVIFFPRAAGGAR